MQRKRTSWLGGVIAGALALVTALLGPVTNYASASVPAWAQTPWVIWSIFALLVLVSVTLISLSRRLDGAAPDTASPLTAVQPLAALRLGSLRPPPPPEHVRGRETVLARLRDLLRRPDEHFAVLCAAGGVGKTTVAAELARQATADEYAVFWIRWRGPESLAEQLTQVAIACGLSEEALQSAQAGQANLPDLVWQQLGSRTQWLIVLDNVDQTDKIGPGPETPADYRGWIRPNGGGLLLVTSRDTDEDIWGNRAELLRLTALDAQAGSQMLLDAAPEAGTPAEAEALAKRLGGMPLALRAVARYLTRRTSRYRTFRIYQEALERDLPSLLATENPNAAAPETARRLVRYTWELSLTQLETDGIPLARTLFRLLALFAEAPIPLSLVTPDLVRTATGQTITQTELDRALAGLDRYDLLGAPDISPNTDPPTVVLHPLVREITTFAHTTETPDTSAWRHAITHSLITAVAEISDAGRSGWDTARLLAPHVAPLLTPEQDGLAPFTNVRDALNDLGNLLDDAGLHASRLILHQAVHEADERAFGTERRDTLKSRNNLAATLNDLGRYTEAAELHRKNLEASTRAQGLDHPETLDPRNNLAVSLNGLGHYAEAAELLRENLEASTRTRGPDHPGTLTSRNNLASTLNDLGQHAEAAELHRKNLEALTRTRGPDHPNTLTSRDNLAATLAALGRRSRFRSLRRFIGGRYRRSSL